MSRIALVLVDIQRDFWVPLSEDSEFKEFPMNVVKLREYALEQVWPVIHVRSLFSKDRSDWMLFYRPEGRGSIPCIVGTEGSRFAEFAEPVKNESIITKQVFDAFKGTVLLETLRELGVDTVVLAGIETSVCVLFTATSAYLNQILPVVVSDACADSPERHMRALEMYSDLCFKTATTGQITTSPDYLNKLVMSFASDKK